jgi:hypothetical protein
MGSITNVKLIAVTLGTGRGENTRSSESEQNIYDSGLNKPRRFLTCFYIKNISIEAFLTHISAYD